MSKEVLQITISKSKIKTPKTRFRRWLFWNVYWNVWKVWRPRLMSKIWHGLYLLLTPASMKKKIDKELEEINIVVKFDDTE